MIEFLRKTDLLTKIGQKCRERRKQKGLSCNAVAKILKIDPAGYNRFENGVRWFSLKNLEKVLAFYKFKILFDIEQEFKPVVEKPEKKIHCPKCLARFLI